MSYLTRRMCLILLAIMGVSLFFVQVCGADAEVVDFQFLVGVWDGTWEGTVYKGTIKLVITKVSQNSVKGMVEVKGSPNGDGEESLNATIQKINGSVMLMFRRRGTVTYWLNIVSEERLEGVAQGISSSRVSINKVR